MQSGRCDSCFKPALPGLDHDLAKKMASKNDPNKQAAVRIWIEAVTKKSITADLQASLKSGVVLCELINAIKPGSVTRINQGAMPFVQRENIVAYLDACKKFGLRETDLFVTQDLFEGSNMAQVVDQICALGQKASTSGYRGPQLVISGGAVQVASPIGRVQAPVSPQVPLVAAPYSSPSAATPATNSYKTAPSSASSPPPVAQRPFVPSTSPSASTGSSATATGPKFCPNCGTKRTDLNATFCGECGKKVL